MTDRLSVAVVKWSGWPLLVIGVFLLFLAPAAESRFMPVRIDQSVANVVRSATELCFDWTSTKVRDRVSDGIDAYLTVYDRQDGAFLEADREATTIYGKQTRKPWARSSALPPTHRPQTQTYCTTIAPFIRPDMPVKLEMLAYYPGLLPLWHSTLRIPTVIDPADAKVP